MIHIHYIIVLLPKYPTDLRNIDLPHKRLFNLWKKPIENIAGKGNRGNRMFSIFQNVFYPVIEKIAPFDPR